jgi:hypothetical protein
MSLLNLDTKPLSSDQREPAFCLLCNSLVAENCRASILHITPERFEEFSTIDTYERISACWSLLAPTSQKLVVCVVKRGTLNPLGYICTPCMEDHCARVRETLGVGPKPAYLQGEELREYVQGRASGGYSVSVTRSERTASSTSQGA